MFKYFLVRSDLQNINNFKGLLYSLSAVILWAILPVFLVFIIPAVDATTVSFYRFLIAGIFLFIILFLKKLLPSFKLVISYSILFIIAITSLSIHYVTFLLGFSKSSPETAQTVIQLAPMFLIVSSIFFFRESFSKVQTFGYLILLLGLGLFFNNRDFSSFKGYFEGVTILVFSALLWSFYALAQKKLSSYFSSQAILVVVYFGCVFFLFPFSSIKKVLNLSKLELLMLFLASINTLLGYGSFAKALSFWDGSRVGAVLSLTPLGTLGFIWLFSMLFKGIVVPDKLNFLSIIGVFLVVIGSIITSLWREKT